jgi:dihydroflavonol-4-reductase
LGVGALMDLGSKVTGKAPLLSVKDIRMFSGLRPDFDITKSRLELGFNPKSPAAAVREALAYLAERDQH